MATVDALPVEIERAAVRAAWRELAREDLLTFCQHVDRRYTLAPHLSLVAGALERLERGEIRRLIISMPPQHGKTQLASRYLLPWALGRAEARGERAAYAVASYGQRRAADITRGHRNLLQSREYGELFPHVRLVDDKQAADQWETRGGSSMLAAGVGGALTGFPVSHIAVIDDPVKDMEAALSRVQLDAVWDWYRSVLLTRLHRDARLLLILTRWSRLDLAGRLLEEEAGDWEVLRLPAIMDEGTDHERALWPERFPLSMLHRIRRSVGRRIWSALYQQEPIEDAEALFRDPVRQDPPLVDQHGRPSSIRFAGYLDPAYQGADTTALSVGGVGADGLLYLTCGQLWEIPALQAVEQIAAYCRAQNVGVLWVEINADQGYTAAALEKAGLTVRRIRQTRNKNARIVGSVLRVWDRLRIGRQVSRQYLDQLLEYSERARHDDAADSLAGLVEVLLPERAEARIVERP